jgi:hypothetical protein
MSTGRTDGETTAARRENLGRPVKLVALAFLTAMSVVGEQVEEALEEYRRDRLAQRGMAPGSSARW